MIAIKMLLGKKITATDVDDDLLNMCDECHRNCLEQCCPIAEAVWAMTKDFGSEEKRNKQFMSIMADIHCFQSIDNMKKFIKENALYFDDGSEQ